MEQLQRFLARAGVGGRRKCADLISAGRVSVGGEVVRHPGHRVSPEQDNVAIDGRRLEPGPGPIYLVMNKPAGYVTTRRDPRAKRTVMELLEAGIARHVYPVGRLDRDATGLLLFTNDGQLAHRLLHPSHHVPRAYEVTVAGRPSAGALSTLATGVELEDGKTAPARVKTHRLDDRQSRLKVTLCEGRKNQLKRMCAAVGHPVRSLRRVSFGSLHLGALAPGACRPLRDPEVRALEEAVGLDDPDRDRPGTAEP